MEAKPPAGLVSRPDRPSVRPTLALRDRVIARLGDAFANGSFDLEEFERRVTVVQQSESVRELDEIVSDLPAVPEPAAPATRALVPHREVKARATVFTAMGGVERRGSWVVPRRLDVYTIMGGASIDLREARLPEGDVEIHVRSLMGGVEIIVPPNLAVESSGAAIMGGFEHVDRAPATVEPGTTILRVSGVVMMGGVSIEMRLPGESPRQARKRRRREARGK
jgi:Domain of unknown function (DUF1707)/Cell wall-active antibiotics response 4TMS YvqF